MSASRCVESTPLLHAGGRGDKSLESRGSKCSSQQAGETLLGRGYNTETKIASSALAICVLGAVVVFLHSPRSEKIIKLAEPSKWTTVNRGQCQAAVAADTFWDDLFPENCNNGQCTCQNSMFVINQADLLAVAQAAPPSPSSVGWKKLLIGGAPKCGTDALREFFDHIQPGAGENWNGRTDCASFPEPAADLKVGFFVREPLSRFRSGYLEVFSTHCNEWAAFRQLNKKTWPRLVAHQTNKKQQFACVAFQLENGQRVTPADGKRFNVLALTEYFNDMKAGYRNMHTVPQSSFLLGLAMRYNAEVWKVEDGLENGLSSLGFEANFGEIHHKSTTDYELLDGAFTPQNVADFCENFKMDYTCLGYPMTEMCTTN